MDLLKRFGLNSCKLAATRMNINEKFQPKDGTNATNAKKIRSLVEGLIYLTNTRSNITFSIGIISRFM